jgi:hypothetical protein
MERQPVMVTYEEIRKALAKSKARWTLPDHLEGEVPIRATGGKISKETIDKENALLKESDINSVLEDVRKSRPHFSFESKKKEHKEDS